MPLSPSSSRRTLARAARSRGQPRLLWRVLAGVIAAQLAVAASASAQGLIAGRVLDAGTKEPVAGAQVTVQGTTLGNLTGIDGRFRIRGATEGSQVTVVARRIGYAAAHKVVTVSDTTVEFLLNEQAIGLSEVVVTGTPGAVSKREIGNSITTVDAASITKIAPVQSFQELLNGRAPNVTIIQGSGEVGSGAKIRVRGTSSFDLSQTPLMYIDGVRIDNDQATGPVNQAFGSSSISRWNDIDPDDIERVEILKGPSAGTLYGTEASNGVVQIITKQGAAGPARFDFNISTGSNFIMNPQGRWGTNYNFTDDGGVDSIKFSQLNNLYKQHTGQDIFQNGFTQKYRAGVGGGTDNFQYYASAVREEDGGVEPNNSLGRTNAMANLSVEPSDKLRIQAHLNYLTGRTNLAPEAGYGGRVWTTVLMDPNNLSDPNEYGFYSGLPWQYDEEYHMNQDVNRFTGSVQITNTPTSWFTHRLIIGADQVNTMDVELAARIDSLQSTTIGSDALGYKVQSNNTDGFRTFDYAATATFEPMDSWRFATSVGAQYYTKSYEYVSASGSVFSFQGLTSINALTQGFSTAQDITQNRTLGYYAQEEIGWKDRRYLTLALRSDKNSAFGVNYKRAYYPKASLSWVVSDEPFWHIDWLNSFRFRTAYGESGEQPDQFAALRYYSPVTGPGDQPAVTAGGLGNSKLGPERGKEFETGFDASLFEDRIGIEATYYNKRTANAILSANVPGSVGFGSTQIVNAGEVKNTGVELLARFTPIRNETLTWDASASFSYNNNKIVGLGVPGVSSFSPGSYQEDRAGYPIGAWFLPKIVSAQLDESGNAYDVMCADGHGGQTDCSNAPSVYLGSSIPDKEGSFTSTLTLWKRLRIYGLVDYQTGVFKIDGNYRIRCFFQIGGLCPEFVFPTKYSPVLEAGIQNGMPFYLVKNANFFKLRTVSATYSLPDELAARLHAAAASITLAGNNLHTWTPYKGLDPESQFLGGSRGGGATGNVAWEQTTTPSLTSFSATLNLTF